MCVELNIYSLNTASMRLCERKLTRETCIGEFDARGKGSLLFGKTLPYIDHRHRTPLLNHMPSVFVLCIMRYKCGVGGWEMLRIVIENLCKANIGCVLINTQFYRFFLKVLKDRLLLVYDFF